jgi:hypothetical protein
VRREEAPVELDEVMRHVLLEEDRPVARPEHDVAHDLLAVRFLRAQHLVAAGMVGAADAQVVGVERLVDDARVGALREGDHQRGGDVARARPEAEAQDVVARGVQGSADAAARAP